MKIPTTQLYAILFVGMQEYTLFCVAQLFLDIFKSLDQFFVNKNVKKRALKVAHNRPKPFLFHSPAQTTGHSPELIFYTMKSRDQTSILLSLLCCGCLWSGLSPFV